MRVICPHCQTIYQLQGMDPDAVLVCHRCGTEFGLGEKPEDAVDVDPGTLADGQTPDMFAGLQAPDSIDDADPGSDPGTLSTASIPEEDIHAPTQQTAAESIGNQGFPGDEYPAQPDDDTGPAQQGDVHQGNTPEQVDEPAGDIPAPVIIPSRETWDDAPAAGTEPATEDEAEPESETAPQPEDEAKQDSIQDDDIPSGPPPRARARIMPWLITVVLLIGGTGFWVNHDAWLDDPWLRSVLINAGIDMEIRDKDWLVDPDSVSAVWVERKGADTALVITGEVGNRLQTDLQPPLIHVTLFARDNPDEVITERDMIITRPPLMQSIRRAPFIAPPRDNTPVAALEKRGFVLVLENLPQNAGNFTLQAKAR